MPVVTLTDVTLRNLKPTPGKQVTYIDKALKGFGVRVSETGAMSYVLTYGADRKRIKIGDVGVATLKGARERAKTLLAEKQLGIAKPAEKSPTFDEAKALFLAACAQKNKTRTVKDYKRLLSRHFAFGKKPVNEIIAQDINRRVDKLAGTVSEQNHAIVCIKIFMRWCQRRQYIDRSPCEGMQTIKRPPRDRILSDAEVRAIYSTAVELDTPFSRIVRLCILIGLRRTEVAWLRHSFFKDETLTLPASLTKNKREFVTPVCGLAQDLIASLPKDDDRLFPAERGDKVFAGWGRQKELFDKALAERGHKVAPWVLHDLRKYFATTHARIGTPIHITERLLHHISGSTTGGLIAVYQLHTFFPEMKVAMHNYQNHVSGLLFQERAAA
jgi:site-specific recombinase XerD